MCSSSNLESESLQSYVFRRILLHGGNDFSSVVSSDGMWKVQVDLSPSQQRYFRNGSEEVLLSLVKQNYQEYIRVDYHHNPFFYLELYKVLFGICSNRAGMQQFPQLSGRKKAISFCKKCVTDSIRNYGYGYFKASWDKQTFCDVHNVPLSYLPSSSKKKNVEQIRVILQGREPEEAKQHSVKHNDTSGINRSSFFRLPVSPCLLKLVLNKLRRVVSDYFSDDNLYDERLENLMVSMDRKLLYSSGIYREPNAVLIDRYIKSLIEKQHFPFVDFLSGLYEEVVASNGVDKSMSCSERMLAPKTRDCLSCEHSKKTCDLSLKIVSFVAYRDVDKPMVENYCDRVKKNAKEWYPKQIDLLHLDTPDEIDNVWFIKDSDFLYDLVDILA